ncbi:hypothetical protein MMB232_01151 [Brevundimonas subvibrioides]|uniref:hypothetical protein n=1 Tax=Brevundimonas subvibrioides TaxID=74313 RepID=UPI0032D5AC2D
MAWATAGMAVVGGLALLIGQAMPRSVAGPMMLQSTAHEARAASALESSTSPEALERARGETRAGLALNPNNPVAWMRLAWIEDQLAGGGFPDASQRAVARAYDVAPYGPQVSSYRLTFILDRWPTASASLRDQARSEIAVMWLNQRQTLQRAVARSVSRPGRLSARATMVRMAAQNPGR